jgi:uncharacterized Fe-S cluster-containing radical SAM superfamily enzyme
MEFKDLAFAEQDNQIEVIFLRLFHFFIDKSQLEKIGKYKIKKNSIDFIDAHRPEQKFNNLLNKGFQNMENRINKKKAVYIHKNSGIPLIGNMAFGIIDRNTNIIEIRPISTCNLSCIYCSVDPAKRQIEFVVEKDYLIQELKKIIDFKSADNIEAHINSQGEPLLYADIVDLVKDIKKIKQIKTISIDTNATLLTKNLADKLINAGLTRFNISINALNQKLCEKIAETKAYNLDKVIEICRYISKKADIILAPLWLKGINDDELAKIIEFAKTLKNPKHKITVGIQNFLYYKFGKNPVKQQSWNKFKKLLSELEKKYNIKLILDFKKDFKVMQTKPLPKPFKKGNIINAKVILQGQLKNEYIAVADNRTISVFGRAKLGKINKIKLIRTKHNIFTAKAV